MKILWMVMVGIGFIYTNQSLGQTPLRFTATTVNEEGAIRLDWESKTNGIYRIESLDALQSSNNSWMPLYEDYPSHGTNTFWLDTGNYFVTPTVHHPKRNLTRFYRVVETGTNRTPVPAVSITEPANLAVLGGDISISVSANSSLSSLELFLYVDGEEIDNGSRSTTNFIINTCEWPNGPHTLFLVAKAATGFDTSPGHPNVIHTYAVSSHVKVYFNNFVSKVTFSEAFFEPSLGQTQRVSALFPTNAAAWTLTIKDGVNNVVRNVAGNGVSMDFEWDGKDDGGNDLPNGNYNYEISGWIPTANPSLGIGGSETNSPPPPPGSSSSSDFGASTPDGLYIDYWVYYPPAPPGMEQQQPEIRRRAALSLSSLNVTQFIDPDFPDIDFPTFPQTTVTPKRIPIAPVKGAAGNFGVAYYTFGPDGRTNSWPSNGLPGPANRVVLNDNNVAEPVVITNFFTVKNLANNFAKTMRNAGWAMKFNKPDGNLDGMELKRADSGIGGSNLFNQVNLGLFVTHGFYGSTVDYSTTASQSLQTYLLLGGKHPPGSYIRLSEFHFDGDLRWMALMACDSLRWSNVESMKNKGVLPLGNNCHLMLGGGSTIYLTTRIGEIWAKNMLRNISVADSWFDAGTAEYLGATTIDHTVKFDIAGWDACFGDFLHSYTEPDPTFDSIDHIERIVFTP